MFTHLVGERAAELNDLLTHGGFRRSQSIAYRPACETCRACISVRVVAERFGLRAACAVSWIATAILPPKCGSQCRRPSSIPCSARYLDARHRDGGMADMTVLDYAMMVEDSHVDTRMVEYRPARPDSADQRAAAGRLLAVAFDRRAKRRTVDGLFVLRFRRGLALARHIHDPRPHRARRRMGLSYVYLGYWVQGSRKMDYKGRFLPQERLTPDGWKLVEQ